MAHALLLRPMRQRAALCGWVFASVCSTLLYADSTRLVESDQQLDFFAGIKELCPESTTSIRARKEHMQEMRKIAESLGLVALSGAGGGFESNVSVEIREKKGSGLGVFLLEPVKKGNLVWTGNNDIVYFHRRSDFEAFLTRLSPAAACEVLHYVYQDLSGCAQACNGVCCEDTEKDSSAAVVLTLDWGSIINHGGEDATTGAAADGSMATIAKRDLVPGDEISENYNSFEWDIPWFKALFTD